MAASALTVSTVVRAGINLTDLDAAANVDGNYFTNTGNEILYALNGDGSSTTITLVYAATTDGQAITNKTVSVPAGKAMILGPFPVEFYNDANSRMNLTYSSVTSLTVLAMKVLPKQ
jgi:hypothetical protein